MFSKSRCLVQSEPASRSVRSEPINHFTVRLIHRFTFELYHKLTEEADAVSKPQQLFDV